MNASSVLIPFFSGSGAIETTNPQAGKESFKLLVHSTFNNFKMARRKSVEPLYKLSDTVLCNFHGQLYDAIILETKHVDILEKEKAEASGSENSSAEPISVRSLSSENGEVCSDSEGFAYYLHYKNWNSSWDEWVRSDCLMAITEESRQRQQELKLAAKKEKIKRNSKKRRRRGVGRKSVPSSSQNDNLDESLSQVGTVNETLESQEPMDESTSNVDDVLADEDELVNERDEDPGVRPAAGNPDDSTNDCTSVEAEMNAPTDDPSTESPAALQGDGDDKPPKSEKASIIIENSLTDPDLVPPNEANAEEKEFKNPVDLGTSEDLVESTPSNVITSDTADEVEKQMLTGGMSDEDVLPNESKTAITAQELETTNTKNDHVGEIVKAKGTLEPKGGERKLSASTRHIGIEVVHPCFAIGTPTINDVLPELQDYLCSISSIGNVVGPAFVEKLGDMYEIFCREFALTSVKYNTEQTMIKHGVSSFGSIVHFSGLLTLINSLEDGEWCNARHYKRLPLAEKSYELEDLETIFCACKDYFEAAKTFLLSKKDHDLRNIGANAEGSKDQNVSISDQNDVSQSEQTQPTAEGISPSDVHEEPVQVVTNESTGPVTENVSVEPAVVLPDSENTLESSCNIHGRSPVECISSKGEKVVDVDQVPTAKETPQSQKKVDENEEISGQTDVKMEESKPQIEHCMTELLDNSSETDVGASSSVNNALLVNKSEEESLDDKGDGEQIPIHVSPSPEDHPEKKVAQSSKQKSKFSKSDHENVPARTMRTRRSVIEAKTPENAMSDHSDTFQKTTRLTRQRKINASNEVASETALNAPSFSSAGSSSLIPLTPAHETVVALMPVRRKRKSETMSLMTSLPSSQNSPSSIHDDDKVHEYLGSVGKRTCLRRKVVNYKE